MTKFIFITGGVTSSLGKGLASAALASLLQSRGFKVHLKKVYEIFKIYSNSYGIVNFFWYISYHLYCI